MRPTVKNGTPTKGAGKKTDAPRVEATYAWPETYDSQCSAPAAPHRLRYRNLEGGVRFVVDEMRK